MFEYDLDLEFNLMASWKIKQRMEVDRRKTREVNHPSTSSSSSNDANFDIIMKKMERLMDRLALDNR